MSGWYYLILMAWYILTVPFWLFLPLWVTTEKLDHWNDYVSGWLCIILTTVFVVIDSALLFGICYLLGI
ncbi:hypothetical protein [Bacillus cereus]|uniref:hypothetical protein n=1 Tax=Bacillus cereus TaxID=1396 RepID=UPI003D995632